jgi:hypothetical protein
MRKQLGKITHFDIGLGGYDGAMFGISVTFEGKGWGVADFDGTWADKPTERHKWTEEDQTKLWGDMCRRAVNLMKQAKATTCADMVGVPVELSFNGNALDSWRILEEVL